MTKTLQGIVESMYSLQNNEAQNRMYLNYEEVKSIIAEMKIYMEAIKETPFFQVNYVVNGGILYPNTPQELNTVFQTENKDEAFRLFKEIDIYNIAVIISIIPYPFPSDEINYTIKYYKKNIESGELSYPQPLTINAQNERDAMYKFYDMKCNRDSAIVEVKPQL